MSLQNRTYTPKRGARVCTRIARGDPISVANSARVTHEILQRWLDEEEDFRAKYAAACERLADRLVAEMAAIADDASKDYKAGGKDGQARVLDRDALARAKLRIETRRWRAARLAPHKYGDKAQPVARAPEPFHYEDILAALG